MKFLVLLFTLLPIFSFAQPCSVIVDFCETEPEFPGGEDSMKIYIDEKVKALGLSGTSGNVFVQFVVATDGSLSDIVVIKKLSPQLDAEAIKIIEGMPKWTPGKQRGELQCVRYTIPVSFGPYTGEPEPELIIFEPEKKRKKRK